MIKIKDLLDKVRLVWISLISNIKSFFLGSHHKSSADEQYANSNNYGDSNIEETHGENTLESEQEEVWYDALEELEESELDEEEYFDAVEDVNKQEANIDNRRKEYEQGKYYRLQNALQEKTEFDSSTQTLALAFEINELIPGNCNTDFSNLKLCEIKKVDHRYDLLLEDDQKNRVALRSEYLNMYFPTYFEKHREKKTYAELFSPKENGIANDIIIPLQVPQNVEIFAKKRSFDPRRVIQSKIPDFPADVYLEDCEGHVKFHLNSDDNVISLSITSTQAKLASAASGTPFKTEWPIKDVLVRGEFANTINKHIREQDEEEKVNFGFEVLVGITKVEEQKREI